MKNNRPNYCLIRIAKFCSLVVFINRKKIRLIEIVNVQNRTTYKVFVLSKTKYENFAEIFSTREKPCNVRYQTIQLNLYMKTTLLDHMTSTAQKTKKYIDTHPSVKDCLKKGVLNYSKLSRKIAKELQIANKTSMEAILVACRRYEAELKEKELLEEKIIEIFKNSELVIKNKIVVAVVDKNIYAGKLKEIEEQLRKDAEIFYAIEGTKAITLVISEKNLGKLKTLFKKHIIKLTKDLAMITIKSPEQIESTPGSLSYILSLFAERGINIQETMSCWTDTIIIVEEKEIPSVMEFLNFSLYV